MRDLRHTGDSANIAFYGEADNRPGRVWCEVLRSDYDFRRKVPYPRPRFWITVHRIGKGEIARKLYRPVKPVGPGPLPDDVVTRLVRGVLAGTRRGDRE